MKKKQLKVSDIGFSGPVGPFNSKEEALESAKRLIDEYLKGKMYLTGYFCPMCGYVIFRRTKKDYRSCMCGNINIKPNKLGINYQITEPKSFEFEIEITNIELYNDWHYGKNKYGLTKFLNEEHLKRFFEEENKK